MVERSQVQVPAGTVGEFSSPEFSFCADSYFSIRSTPLLPQLQVKDPSHSAENADGRLQLTMHAPCFCGFEQSDIVSCCMVSTEHAPRQQQFHLAPAICNNQTVL